MIAIYEFVCLAVIKSQSFSDFIVTSKYKLTILPIILIVNHTHPRKRHLVDEIHTNSSNQSECASQLDANLCLEQRKNYLQEQQLRW